MIWLQSVDSTNNHIKAYREDIPPFALVLAKSQTAGRGQRGNSWESAPGENLTFSFHFTPKDIAPVEQFVISEAAALAIQGVLADFGICAKVKWPNDIYVDDRKICGILIENSILGSSISDCIVGVGLNVNQESFLSDAPNPVSMWQLTGRKHDLKDVAGVIEKNVEKYFALLECREGRDSLERQYHEALWRRDGRKHWFRDTANGEEFAAMIMRVEPTGHLVLRTGDDGHETRRYAFKEVSFVI